MNVPKTIILINGTTSTIIGDIPIDMVNKIIRTGTYNKTRDGNQNNN